MHEKKGPGIAVHFQVTLTDFSIRRYQKTVDDNGEDDE